MQDPFPRIAAMLAAEDDFDALVRLGGLDPATDFIGADLRHVRFGPRLDGFLLHGADLRGTNIAEVAPGYFADGTTRLPAGAILRRPADFDAAKARAMILAGEAPPARWRPFITKLDLSDEKEFVRLASLGGCFNLRELNISRTAVDDLAPIAGLANLQTLRLSDTKVQDLAPIAGLANLQFLYLNGTQVQDLAPIAGLANLQYLTLVGTQVQDLAPIAGLANLQTLDLASTQVQDLAPIAGLANLQNLDLIGTQVQDLAPIAGLADLEYLWLDRTQVQDLAPIAGLANLQYLLLTGTKVQDLAPIAGLIAGGLRVDGKGDLLERLRRDAAASQARSLGAKSGSRLGGGRKGG